MTTVKNSRHVNTNTPFIRRRNAAVRKSFARHLSVARKEMVNITIQFLDESSITDSLTDDLIRWAMAAHALGVNNAEDYLHPDGWMTSFAVLFDHELEVVDWADLFGLTISNRRVLHQKALGFIEGLAIWWQSVSEATEPEPEPAPKRQRRELVAA